jgi:hypothetical protein
LFFEEGILRELWPHVLGLAHAESLREDSGDALFFRDWGGQAVLHSLQALDVVGVYNLIFPYLLIVR